jgi:acyl dehydratase
MKAVEGEITGVNARFAGIVFPGDELALELWRTGDKTWYGRVSVPRRDAVVVDPLEISTTPAATPPTAH